MGGGVGREWLVGGVCVFVYFSAVLCGFLAVSGGAHARWRWQKIVAGSSGVEADVESGGGKYIVQGSREWARGELCRGI